MSSKWREARHIGTMDVNSSIHDILEKILCVSGIETDIDEIFAANRDVKVIKNKINVRFDKEDETAYVIFCYDNKWYKTILRGRHQAVNCAYCLEIVKRLRSRGFNITDEHINCAFSEVGLNGRFETLKQSPTVIFDVVENAFDAKNFITAVDDYFGRDMQAQLRNSKNLHPAPFRRLVIADCFYPQFTEIKQSMMFIFTNNELRNQYLEAYSGIVKTHVMPIDVAVETVLKDYSDHKIFVIGGRDLYKKVQSLL